MSQLQVLFVRNLSIPKKRVRPSLRLDEELHLQGDRYDYSAASYAEFMSHNRYTIDRRGEIGLLVNKRRMEPHEVYLATRVPLWLRAVFPALGFFFLAASAIGFLVGNLAVGIASLGPLLSAFLVTVSLVRKRRHIAQQ
jgi:hypothetical protein